MKPRQLLSPSWVEGGLFPDAVRVWALGAAILLLAGCSTGNPPPRGKGVGGGVIQDHAPALLANQAKAPAEEQGPVAPPGMSLVPSGVFQMGESAGPEGEATRPLHAVFVSAFYIDRYEVTKEMWDEVCNWATNHGYAFPSWCQGKAPNHPVHSVTWGNAVEWCNARSEREGLTPAYYTDRHHRQVLRSNRLRLAIRNEHVKWDSDGYRLPTEAEWEKAAKGGLDGKRYPWGDAITQERANYGLHSLYAVGPEPYTSPVGSFPPNGYGLYDMAGNVEEWCWDRHESTRVGKRTAFQPDPRGPASGRGGLLKGGKYSDRGLWCRCASFKTTDASYVACFIGFRCVRKP